MVPVCPQMFRAASRARNKMFSLSASISKDVLVKQAACLRFVYTVFEDKHRSVFPRTQGVFFYLPVVDGSRDVIFGIGIQAGMGEMLEQFYPFGIVPGGGFAERMVRFLPDTFFACL